MTAIDKIVTSMANDTEKSELVTLLIDSVALTFGASYNLSLERRSIVQSKGDGIFVWR